MLPASSGLPSLVIGCREVFVESCQEWSKRLEHVVFGSISVVKLGQVPGLPDEQSEALAVREFLIDQLPRNPGFLLFVNSHLDLVDLPLLRHTVANETDWDVWNVAPSCFQARTEDLQKLVTGGGDVAPVDLSLAVGESFFPAASGAQASSAKLATLPKWAMGNHAWMFRPSGVLPAIRALLPLTLSVIKHRVALPTSSASATASLVTSELPMRFGDALCKMQNARVVMSLPYCMKPAITEQAYPFFQEWHETLAGKRVGVVPDGTGRRVVWFLCWDEGLAGCGMPAHALMLALCTDLGLRAEQSDDASSSSSFDCVVVVKSQTRLKRSRAMGMPLIPFSQAMNDARWNHPSVVFELTWLLDAPDREVIVKRRGARLVRWQAGGSLPDSEFRMVMPFWLKTHDERSHELVSTGILPTNAPGDVHMILYNPHYEYQRQFLERLTDAPSGVTPYLWSSCFVRSHFGPVPDDLPHDEPRSRDDYATFWNEQRLKFHSLSREAFPDREDCALVAEPNTTVNKCSLLPLMICRETNRPDHAAAAAASAPRAVLRSTYLTVSPNTAKFAQWNSVLTEFRKYPWSPELVTEPRQPLGALCVKADILVSHQHRCAMNNLTLDTLFLGMRVIHNAGCWSGAGYVYEDTDIAGGVEQVRRALRRRESSSTVPYDPETGRLAEGTIDLLWSMSPFHPDNQRRCVDILRRITSQSENDA